MKAVIASIAIVIIMVYILATIGWLISSRRVVGSVAMFGLAITTREHDGYATGVTPAIRVNAILTPIREVYHYGYCYHCHE